MLRFPALRTGSLLEADARGIAALHLEAKLRFRSADVGLARLQIKGQADTSVSPEAASAQ